MKMITVLGEGAWGTAVASVLAYNGYRVKLWCYHPEIVGAIQQGRCNPRYLPEVALSEYIEPVTDIVDAVSQADYIFEAIPVKHLRSVLEQVQGHAPPDPTWVVLSKGIENGTLQFPSQIIDDLFGLDSKKVVIAGPSYAHELARQYKTGLVCAAHDQTLAQSVAQLLRNRYVVTRFSSDLLGVQAASAFKNVIAIGMGMLDGGGYQNNTKALFFTDALDQMVYFIESIGGNPATAYGLAGIGDLMLTATGSLSRNQKVGYLIAQGMSLEDIIAEYQCIPEGVNTVRSLIQLSLQRSLELPICAAVYDIIYSQHSIEELVVI